MGDALVRRCTAGWALGREVVRMHFPRSFFVALPFVAWWLAQQIVDRLGREGWSDAWLLFRNASNMSLNMLVVFWAVIGSAPLMWRLSVGGLAVAISMLAPPEYGITIIADLVALLGFAIGLIVASRFLKLKLGTENNSGRRRAWSAYLFVLCTLFALISVSIGKVSWPDFQVGPWTRLVYPMLYMVASQLLLGIVLLPVSSHVVFGIHHVRHARFAVAITGLATLFSVIGQGLLMQLTFGVTKPVASIETTVVVLLFFTASFHWLRIWGYQMSQASR